MKRKHGMPFGAEVRSDGSVRFRLWAPTAKSVHVSLVDRAEHRPAAPLDNGWFELIVPALPTGSLYKYRIDGKLEVPDPASRFQPNDVHGPSEIIDPVEFSWNDGDWHGRAWEETALYELHVGTFTPQGTFAGVENKLDYLAQLGLSAIELMPVSDFPGKRNWGYDGVLPFAPDSSYGRPEDLKRLVQAAHQRGLMVILDVVYNHFGPEGNYLRFHSSEFFTHRHKTPWGDAINFDGSGSRIVRQYFIHNALYWFEEYHFDGLRLDAAHAMEDDSEPDLLTELAEAVRQRFGLDRHIHLVLENDDNAAHYLSRDEHGRPQLYNAQWNDDIHHAFHVLITGETDGYYADYAERPLWRLGRCLAEGFAFQNDPSPYRGGAHRGEISRFLPPQCFVDFLQNHDQIGNRAFGDRISNLAEWQAIKAVTAIMLLAPAVPLIFMGDEFGAATPFLFFCDFGPDLAAAVTRGRREEFARFSHFKSEKSRNQIPDPNSEQTFRESKLDWEAVHQPLGSERIQFFQDLFSRRAKHIVPLLRGTRHPSARFELFDDGGLMVNWNFGETRQLSLFTNLQPRPSTMTRVPEGELIYDTANDVSLHESEEVPPWTVAWYLRQ